MLAHAWRGQDEDWPQPGCRKTQNVSWNEPPFWRLTWPGPCTSNGGHAYSIDGREWHISPIPPYSAETEFDDGSTVFWRARERPHIVFDEHGELAYLLNGVGDPIQVNCTDAPSTPGRIQTDPTACQCPDSGFFPCPPQTGGSNTGGPGGDHTFTLLQPIAKKPVVRVLKTDEKQDNIGYSSSISPLYGDPLFDGAHDAELVWHEGEQCWWLTYLQNRYNSCAKGGSATGSATGTDLGLASTPNGGRTWIYRGVMAGLDVPAGDRQEPLPCAQQYTVCR